LRVACYIRDLRVACEAYDSNQIITLRPNLFPFLFLFPISNPNEN
jgi:hypothetical protein